MPNLTEVKSQAAARVRTGAMEEALALYMAAASVSPIDIEAAIRVADCVAALAGLPAAAPLYQLLAKYSLKSGHPLPGLVCIRVLEEGGVDTRDLLKDVVARCSSAGQNAGPAARLSMPPIDTGVVAPRAERGPALIALAKSQLQNTLLQTRDYPQAVPPIQLLSELTPEALERVLGTMVVRRVPHGVKVLTQGERGESFFFVAGGSVRVETCQPGEDPVEVAVLHENAIFGEMALIRAEPRSASVIAVGEADLLEFTRTSLRALSSEMASVAEALDRFTRSRLLSNLLARSPLFRPFPTTIKQELLRRFTAHDVKAGDIVIEEGEAGQGLFLVLAGNLAVQTGHSETIAELGPSDVFGEMALIRDAPTSATVTARTPTSLLFLARENVESLVAGVPQIREYLENLTANRLRDNQLSSEGISAVDDEDVIILL